MKLLDGGKAPNPRRVRIFLAEKGIEVPLEPIDMGALGHKEEAVSQHMTTSSTKNTITPPSQTTRTRSLRALTRLGKMNSPNPLSSFV